MPIPRFSAVGGTVIGLRTTRTFVPHGIIFNGNATSAFLQMFNKLSGDITLGSTSPDFVVEIPPGASREMPGPISFSIALSLACTTTATGNVAAICQVSLTVT